MKRCKEKSSIAMPDNSSKEKSLCSSDMKPAYGVHDAVVALLCSAASSAHWGLPQVPWEKLPCKPFAFWAVHQLSEQLRNATFLIHTERYCKLIQSADLAFEIQDSHKLLRRMVEMQMKVGNNRKQWLGVYRISARKKRSEGPDKQWSLRFHSPCVRKS